MQSTLNALTGVYVSRLLIILGLLEINGLPRAVADRKISDDFALDACSGKFMDLKISSQ
ncbi:MAG: hypothetical protein H6Q53_1076 [Deltaproteobacteria bacterium]|nr:hypothetical protein [Deltaproteobacteria bacterium]